MPRTRSRPSTRSSLRGRTGRGHVEGQRQRHALRLRPAAPLVQRGVGQGRALLEVRQGRVTIAGQVAVVITKAQKDAIVAAAGSPTLRVVFRVHTNRGFDDQSGGTAYTSGGRGAAQVDDVSYDAGLGSVLVGDFEGGDPPRTSTTFSRPPRRGVRPASRPPSRSTPNDSRRSRGPTCAACRDRRRWTATWRAPSSRWATTTEVRPRQVRPHPRARRTVGIVSPTICLKAPGPTDAELHGHHREHGGGRPVPVLVSGLHRRLRRLLDRHPVVPGGAILSVTLRTAPRGGATCARSRTRTSTRSSNA